MRIGLRGISFSCLFFFNVISVNSGTTSRQKKSLTFVVAGQSLAVSFVRGYEAMALTHSVSGRVSIASREADDMIGAPRVPTKKNPTSYGICWLYTGEAVVKAKKRDIVFINIAAGGSRISYWTTRKGTGYNKTLMDAVRRYKPDAVLWIQGDADSGYLTTESMTDFNECYSDLKEIIGQTRAIQPGLPWVVALNASRLHPEAPMKRAQRKIISEGLAFEGPDMEVLRSTPANVADDGIHFGKYGFQALGLAFFNCLLAHHLI